MRSAAFWQILMLVSLVLAGNFGVRLFGNPLAPKVLAAVAPAALDAADREFAHPQRQQPARDDSSWLLARLEKAEAGGELCELLDRLEPADEPAGTYAITGVLERTRLRSVRACAARALARQPNSAARSWLVDLAEDPEPEVHRAALDALATQADTLAQATLADAAHSADLDVRVAAVIALLKARRPETFALAKDLAETLDEPNTLGDLIDALAASADLRALPVLQALIARGDRATHVRAIAALGVLGTKQSLPLLQPYLQVGSEQEFRAAATALARLDPESLLPRLAALLHEGGARRRRLALSTLASLDLPGAADLVSEVLDWDEPQLVTLALRQLANSHDPGLENRFVAVARRDEPATRHVAVYALLRLGTPGALGELRALSKGGSSELAGLALGALKGFPEARAEVSATLIDRVQRASRTAEDAEAVLALASDPSPAAQGAILAYFSDPMRSSETLARVVLNAPSATVAELVERVAGRGEIEQRRALIGALSNRAEPRFSEHLRQAATDEDEGLRQTALRGLLSLGDERARREATGLLDAATPEERRLGIELLGAPSDNASLSKLEALTSDTDSDVAALALSTLKDQVPSRAAEVAQRLFKRGSAEARQTILSTLGGLPGALARPLYEVGARDPDDATALRSLELLAALEGPRTAQTLLDVARDEQRSREVRGAAASALRALGGPLARGNQALLDELSERGVRGPAVCRGAS